MLILFPCLHNSPIVGLTVSGRGRICGETYVDNIDLIIDPTKIERIRNSKLQNVNEIRRNRITFRLGTVFVVHFTVILSFKGQCLYIKTGVNRLVKQN